MRKIFLLLFSAILLCLLASAQDNPAEKRGPSTPEERKRFVNVTKKIIKSPLDENLKAEVKWALQWLNDVPDINVTPCPAPLGDLVGSGNKYAAKIFGIYVLAMGVYAIEHPEKNADELPQYMAGVDGALKAYKAILRDDSQASSEDLDDLLQRQAAGKLEEFVRSASKVCSASGAGPQS